MCVDTRPNPAPATRLSPGLLLHGSGEYVALLRKSLCSQGLGVGR